jgi:hypothetical protein
MKKLLLISLAIFFCFGMMAQTAELKINPEKNKVYRLKSSSEQVVSQTVNGNTADNSVERELCDVDEDDRCNT